MQAQSKKEIKSEDDFNDVLDDILKENGIEVDSKMNKNTLIETIENS